MRKTIYVEDWDGIHTFKRYVDVWKYLDMDIERYNDAETAKIVRREIKKEGRSQLYRGQECVDIWTE